MPSSSDQKTAVGANRQIILAGLPGLGPLTPEHFATVDADRPVPGPGEILCRAILLSIDAANRAWMSGQTYRSQLSAGDVMSGITVAEVVDGNATHIPTGSIVSCEGGWQQYAAVPAHTAHRIGPIAPLTHYVSVLGITGLTAYIGLLDIGRPRPGETVVVSAAAGATGNVVGQIARLAGCRVVGITSSDQKNNELVEHLGFHAAVNRRSESYREDLREACPDGVDVYFDNVGGATLRLLLSRMNIGGRVVCCGAVSVYDGQAPDEGMPASIVVVKRLRVEGFVVLDHASRFAAAQARMAKWLADETLIAVEDVLHGIESAPQALIGLLAGDNLGKRMVRIGPDPV